MANTALLNNVDHHDVRIITRHGAEFGDNVNQAMLFATEIETAQRDYPILIRPDGNGQLQAVALLGLDRRENLFLEEGGVWNARYVPAAHRRGPFMIGFQERDGTREPVIHIDLDHPRVSRTEGEPLFLPKGGNSPYLERAAATLRAMHQGVEAGRAMFAAFIEAELIEPIEVAIELSDRERYTVPNFLTIGAERIAALPTARLEALHRSGFLLAAYLIRSSLGNLERLAEQKRRRLASR